MKSIFSLVLLVALLILGAWFYLSSTYPLTNPSKSLEYFAQRLLTPHSELKQQVFGFLTYWNLDDISYIRPSELSEINYFSLSVGSDGHIITQVNGQNDPGWNGWIKQETKDFITKSQIMGAKISITIAAQDNQTIEAVLNNNTNQQNLISDITSQVRQRKLDGINIDFEYSGQPDDALRQEFTYFSTQLAISLKQANPHAILSLSIMPLSAREQDLFDFPKLIPIYDQFIGMSYDYYGQNSEIAGPVAPMNGFKQGKYFFDVTTTYADYEKYIPKNKLIMGVPYYGWEWAVEDGKMMKSQTFPTDSPNNYAAVISYARSREDTDLKQNQCQWDTVSEETWCWFTDKKTGVDHQVWVVDNQMIQTRFDFAKQQQLAGIAIWELGLDKQYPDLWNMLQSTFGQ